MTLQTIIDALRSQGGLLSTLGIEFDVSGPSVSASMTIEPHHAGAPGIAHGGAIAALLDSALGVEALKLALEAGRLTSTVELKTNFLRPVPVGRRIVVEPEVQSRGKSLLVLSGAAVDTETGERVAFAVGTFNVFATDRLESRA